MQRVATRQSRGANSAEKRFIGWVKQEPCICCNAPAPSIADHAMGATFKKNKVLIGHFWLLPLCQWCDNVKTHGSRRQFISQFGLMSDLWLKLIEKYEGVIPLDVIEAIKAMRDEGK